MVQTILLGGKQSIAIPIPLKQNPNQTLRDTPQAYEASTDYSQSSIKVATSRGAKGMLPASWCMCA